MSIQYIAAPNTGAIQNSCYQSVAVESACMGQTDAIRGASAHAGRPPGAPRRCRTTKLSMTMTQQVALLMVVLGLPPAVSLPRFNWDHITTFAHCSNTTGPLSATTLQAFRNHSFVVLEKVQCLSCAPVRRFCLVLNVQPVGNCSCKPESTVPLLQVNHSCENKMYAASRQLKLASPGIETYVYVAVDVARPMYDAYQWFRTHPSSELHDSAGSLVTHSTAYCPLCPVFDFTAGPTPARWNAVITDAITEGGMDGCFVDGISSGPAFKASLLKGVDPSKQEAWLVALNETLGKLRASTGPGRVLLQNAHAGWPRSHDARIQLGFGGKIDAKLSFGRGSLHADMQLFSETAPRVAALYQNFGSNDKGHASYNVSLAGFLIAMGNSSFWSYTETQKFDGDTWECANWAASTGHEADYVRPLGHPVEAPMNCRAGQKAGEVDCSRSFATGTCAYVSMHGADSRSCVWWSDGAEVGDAATCANQQIRSASCTHSIKHGVVGVRQLGCSSSANANETASCLQAAFDAALPGDVVEIPFTGEPWVVSRPLVLRKHGVSLRLLPGVILEAQRGQFHGISDCLLTIGGLDNPVVGVSVRGSPGACLRMHRADYANTSLYTKAEWRHGLQLVNVVDALVEELRIERTGGDGIYVDQASNTIIRNVDMADNFRQGMSVIAADGLLVEDCLMHGTNGTNPQAGLDIEPNRPQDELVNVTFSRCTSYNNTGNQLDVFLTCLRYRVCGQAERASAVVPGHVSRHDLRSPERKAMLATAAAAAANKSIARPSLRPMSITFQDCSTTSFASYNGPQNGCGGSQGCGDGLIISGVYSSGSITVDRFRAVHNGGSGISIGKAVALDGKISGAVPTLVIRDTVLQSNNPDQHEWRGVQDAEVHLLALPPSFDPNVTAFGGLLLDNVSIIKDLKTTNNRTSWLTAVGTGTIVDIKGSVTIYSVIGCPLMPPYLGTATGVNLDVVCVPIKGYRGGRHIKSDVPSADLHDRWAEYPVVVD